MAARHTVTSSYNPEDAAAFGFESNVATEPAQMELQVQRLLTNFTKPEVQASQPIYPAVKFEPSQGEPMFRPLLDKLKTARAALTKEHRKSDATLLAKDQAVVVNDIEFAQISRCFEAIFTLGERPDLAKRVRPSTRRPGRRQEAENGDVDESSTPPETAPPDETGSEPEISAAAADSTKEVSND
jgi:hypothetical protein